MAYSGISFKSTFKRYLSEIAVIFLGISISFWFDEWRGDRKDRELEQKILQNLRENLTQDSLVFSRTATGFESMLKGVEKLVELKPSAALTDSVGYYIDMAASYTGVFANQVTYEEIRQTGHTRLIQNDTLKKAILGHYTSLLPYVKEWCDVDKTHTMTQLIPEMSHYFPPIIDTNGIVSANKKIEYLKTPKLRYLLITNLAYKKEAVKSIKMASGNTKRLLGMIDRALKK
jgi:hypothetical protein